MKPGGAEKGFDRAAREETLSMLSDMQARLVREGEEVDLGKMKSMKVPTVWMYRIALALFVGFWAVGTAWFCLTYMTREQARSTFATREEIASVMNTLTSINNTQQAMTVSLAVINASMDRVSKMEQQVRELERRP